MNILISNKQIDIEFQIKKKKISNWDLRECKGQSF